MAEKFSYPYTVNADFIDGKLRFTLIGMISLAQTAVSFHYGENRLSIPHMNAKGKTWVVSKQHFEIEEYPLWRDEFVSKSWLEPPHGPFCYYDFAYSYLAQGGRKQDLNQGMQDLNLAQAEKADLAPAPFCRAHSLWLLLDLASLRPSKPDGEDFRTFAYCPEQLFPPKFPKLELPEAWTIEQTFSPRRQEIDLNGHVNNVEYVRYILNWLPDQVADGMLVKTLDTNYVSSAHIDDSLTLRAALLPNGDGEKPEARTCIHQIVRSDGSEVFRAHTVWLPEGQLSRDLHI